MTVGEAVVLVHQEIERSSLRRVAERIGVSHGTVRNWINGRAKPEGRPRELLLDWAHAQSHPPASTSATGIARSILVQLQEAVRRQEDLVRLLEQGATSDEVAMYLASTEEDVEAPATPTAAAPAARRKRGGAGAR